MTTLLNNNEWLAVLMKCGVRATIAARWAGIFAEVIHEGTFSLGREEVDDFLGQVLHESTLLQKLEEDLFYKTPGRLMAVWPGRFKSLDDEKPFLRNPEALANRVYGGRMGNVQPGDGWRFRGSGLIQVTGAVNFAAVQMATGIPVFKQPDLLRQPTAAALRVVIAWWEGHVPDAAMGNVRRVTRTVNGGVIGLAERERLTGEAGEALA